MLKVKFYPDTKVIAARMRTGVETVLEKFASRSEVFRLALVSSRNEWQPDQPPPYRVMAEFAEQTADALRLERQSFEALLLDIEAYIEGGGVAADLVAVGFLEALLGRSSSGRFDFRQIVHLLGPKSLDFCKAWDQFTGCSTVAEAMAESSRV
ncbi:MAG: hypothetical protein ACAI34_02280 [Verrucomicrobium sp.]